MIDWAALSRLVPEIALVIIFAFFNYKRDELYLKKESERDAARLKSDQSRDEERNRYTAEQRQAFLDALKLHQDIYATGMARFSEDLRQLGHTIVAHDEWERGYAEERGRGARPNLSADRRGSQDG